MCSSAGFLCPYSEAGLPCREPFLCAAMAAAASKGQMANAQLCVTGMDPYHSTCLLSTKGCEEAGLAANSRSWLCLMPSLPGQALRERRRRRIWCEKSSLCLIMVAVPCVRSAWPNTLTCVGHAAEARLLASVRDRRCLSNLVIALTALQRPYPVRKHKRITYLTVL